MNTIRLMEQDGQLFFSNEMVRVAVNLTNGKITLTDVLAGRECVSEAYWRIDDFLGLQFSDFSEETYPYFQAKKRLCNIWRDKYPISHFAYTQSDWSDALGEGKRVYVKCVREKGPQITLAITLYRDKGFITFHMGVENTTSLPLRVREFHPLSGAILFKNNTVRSGEMTLDGLSGNGKTLVREGSLIQSSNNLLLTFLAEGERFTFAAGGLTYRDYAKYASIDYKDCQEQRGTICPKTEEGKEGQAERFDIMAYDPHGRLVESGETYFPDDGFYIDFVTKDPFVALEQYAGCVKLAQGVKVNSSQFPIVNGWYVGHRKYGSGIKINSTAGTIEEMDYVQKSGFLKYAPVAVQLEPDKYHGDTEQGWWDDEHWRKHGHHTSPYETTEKWGAAMRARGGIPYIYFQSGLPSDDYAAAHPGHMLFNDISKLHYIHSHHQPHVTFDYTDPDFIAHMREVWSHLQRCGVQGVKFDYPESAWRPEGGFEDKKATTASAYRNLFKLTREGLGQDAVINERNLGESDRPVVDVSVGLVDIQRVWNDASSFQPYMVTKAGLRWYKNRTLYNYDIEAKTFFERKTEAGPLEPLHAYQRQSILTMSYMVSAGLLLANSFRTFTPEMVHEISRVFPIHQEQRMARPVDAFTGIEHPRVYAYRVNADWQQVALFNTDMDKISVVGVNLGGDTVEGALGLDPDCDYYVYSFWDDRFVGVFSGTMQFCETLRPGEARMYSIRKKQLAPQVLSTNRHLLQGYVDMPECSWDGEQTALSGTALVIGGETYTFKIACNGRTARNVVVASDGSQQAELHEGSDHVIEIQIVSEDNREVRWSVNFT